MVGSKVIKNSVHFQYKCSILSPNDKMTKNASKTIFFRQNFKRFCVYFFNIFNFKCFWSWMKKSFLKTFIFILTIKYQNVQTSVNFSHLIIGRGMLLNFAKDQYLFFISRGSPSIYVLSPWGNMWSDWYSNQQAKVHVTDNLNMK